MLELNKVMLIGNLTRDPELSYTSSGSAIAKMGLAVNRSWKDRNGQWQKDTAFVDIDAWGPTAEFCSKYLKKGRRIFVEGRLSFSSWEANDGAKRSKLTVTADRVQFADPPPTGDQGNTGGASQQEQTSPAQGGFRPRAETQSAPAPQRSFPDSGEGSSSDEETADDLPF
ncbi:single-stranded DNA-binding protein [bacterium]|nr:single-stranded DNA-binding protein [bacterium]